MNKDFKEIGALIIPPNVDRTQFINACFNRERFCVMTNRRGVLYNVPCLHQVINDLKFPEDSQQLGSQVLVEYIDEYKQYIIVGTLSKLNESLYLNEETLNYSKIYDGLIEESIGNSIGMVGNSLAALLNIFAKTVNDGKQAKLILESVGNEDSLISLNSSWILINSDKGIKLRYKTEKEITILEDKIEILFSKEQKFTIKDKELIYTDGTNTFKIDDSGYNLGNINFEKYLTKILDFLNNNIILLTSYGPTSAGCASTPSSSQLNQLKQELSQINKNSK